MNILMEYMSRCMTAFMNNVGIATIGRLSNMKERVGNHKNKILALVSLIAITIGAMYVRTPL